MVGTALFGPAGTIVFGAVGAVLGAGQGGKLGSKVKAWVVSKPANEVRHGLVNVIDGVIAAIGPKVERRDAMMDELEERVVPANATDAGMSYCKCRAEQDKTYLMNKSVQLRSLQVDLASNHLDLHHGLHDVMTLIAQSGVHYLDYESPMGRLNEAVQEWRTELKRKGLAR